MVKMLRAMLLGLCWLGAPAYAGVGEGVIGYWASPESILQIARAGEGLSMRVVVLLEPNYGPNEIFGPPGTPRRDAENPDPERRQDPILGLELLRDYRFEKGMWRGRIYDPESGNIYDSTIRLGRNGLLKMRGYIGMPMFGRTETFEPLSACTELIVTMLRAAQPPLSAAGCD